MGDFWSSRIFFSSSLVGMIFFSHKLSITFALHTIFSFQQALAGNFFHNIIGDELLLNFGVKFQR